jgi:hypothetical protein
MQPGCSATWLPLRYAAMTAARATSVDVDDGAVDEQRLVAREVHGGLGKLIGRT